MKTRVSQEVKLAMAEIREASRAAQMQPSCPTGLAHRAGKLGRARMPEPEKNDLSLASDGARMKQPIRYE